MGARPQVSHHLCILSTFPSLNQRFVFTVFNLESKVAAPKKKNRKDVYSIMEYLLTIHHYYDYVLASHGKALHKAKDSNKHLSGHVLLRSIAVFLQHQKFYYKIGEASFFFHITSNGRDIIAD